MIQTVLILIVVGISAGFAIQGLKTARKIDLAAKLAHDASNTAMVVAERAEKSAVSIQRGVDEIHILVNDNLTRAMQGELDQAKGRVAALIRLRRPTPEDLDDIIKVNNLIVELETKLSVRGVQQKLVDSLR